LDWKSFYVGLKAFKEKLSQKTPPVTKKPAIIAPNHLRQNPRIFHVYCGFISIYIMNTMMNLFFEENINTFCNFMMKKHLRKNENPTKRNKITFVQSNFPRMRSCNGFKVI
jgi:hypothetical protein